MRLTKQHAQREYEEKNNMVSGLMLVYHIGETMNLSLMMNKRY